MKGNLLFCMYLFTVSMSALSQSSLELTEDNTNPITFVGYLEPYYSYDFSNPDNHNKPDFIYSYNRHNELNLHLGLLKVSYTTTKIRSNLAYMTGTYANANLSGEPGVLKNIYEVNAGVKISVKKSLWIDAGIFPSHIGFETAIGKDCWTLTRSIMAENTPYYESGVKIGYTSDNGKLFLSGLVLNGWQRIQRVDGNQTMAFGHQLTYKPNSKITLNSSSFVGSDKPDDAKQLRFFHNAYGIFQVSQHLGITLGFDIGTEKQPEGSDGYNVWYSTAVIIKLIPADKINIALRGEYFKDQNGVIIRTGTPNGFQTFGYSLNVDYLITENMMWRNEFRELISKDTIFMLDHNTSTQNYAITSSLAISF